MRRLELAGRNMEEVGRDRASPERRRIERERNKEEQKERDRERETETEMVVG